ncbi:DUF1127 domain-containing protein [Nisaea acidiphila]|uniref:DUF1127 domain-containing protein n=1 Tax=Nisaea acidiphila TaxID=1862145 RepID=A0A9J7ANE2_9PROT|nr:DUF1127 domain-containing protein [Nisaea acidiphila]UUX48952.1 DUF1127 domain-containing protein [Nisaea acidiphila]
MSRRSNSTVHGFNPGAARISNIPGWWLPLQLFRAVTRYLRDRQDYEHMRDLPDYLLKDIGVTRTEIEEKLNRPFL